MTSEPGALRFESFSACCGVHARFDVTPDGLDAEPVTPGTVNVDFNAPMRAALARVTARAPLHLQVGFDAVEVTDAGGLRGRAARAAARALDQGLLRGPARQRGAAAGARARRRRRAAVPARPARARPAARRCGPRPARGGVRLAARPGGGATCVAAPERLRVLEPVARHLTRLVAYAVPDAEAASVWVAELAGARLLVTLSPHFSRGFSGEGGLLDDLADETLAIEAEFLDRALHGRWRFADSELTVTGLDAARARRALTWLGAHGRVGYDVVEDVWFRRELPFPPERLAATRPVCAMRASCSPRARSPRARTARCSSTARDKRYAVRLAPPRCTCPWWSKHPGDRGPCKHLLAARLMPLGGPWRPPA